MFLEFLVSALTFLSYVKAQTAIATFNNSVFGTVTVLKHTIYVNINVSAVNVSLLPSSDCWTNGLKYHIHQYWNHTDNSSRIGSVECGANYTGDHYDPWAACSSKSNNAYCSNNGGCINTSDYSCNTTTYASNIFSCEVGDWSGKYGVAMITNNVSQINASSFWEVEPSDVLGKSVIFHCSTTGDPRAFCAPFELETTSSFNATQVVQDSSSNYAIADFSTINSSYLIMYKNGSYQASIYLSGNTTSMCSNYTYRIYDSWNDSSHTALYGNNCTDVVGSVYDPTRSCFSIYSDDSYCYDGKLCNSSSYIYNCDPTNNLYECSPSDLSGSWNGIISNKSSTFTISGIDDLLIPLDLIIGKSIVIECQNASSFTPVACAKITNNGSIPISTNATNSTSNTTTTTTTSSSITPSPTNNANHINIISAFIVMLSMHAFLM